MNTMLRDFGILNNTLEVRDHDQQGVDPAHQDSQESSCEYALVDNDSSRN